MPGFLQIFLVRFPSGKPQPAANPQDIAAVDVDTTEAECGDSRFMSTRNAGTVNPCLLLNRNSIPSRYNNGIAKCHLSCRDCDLVGVLAKLRMNTDAEAQGVSNEEIGVYDSRRTSPSPDRPSRWLCEHRAGSRDQLCFYPGCRCLRCCIILNQLHCWLF